MAKICLRSCFKDILCERQPRLAGRRASSWVQCSGSHASLGLQESLAKHYFMVLTKPICKVLSCMTCTEACCSYKSCMTRASFSTSAIQEICLCTSHCSQSASALVSDDIKTMQHQPTEQSHESRRLGKVKNTHLQCILMLVLELGNLALLFLLLMPGSRHSRQHAMQLRLHAAYLLFFLQAHRDLVLSAASLRQADTEQPPDKTWALVLWDKRSFVSPQSLHNIKPD